MASKGNGGGGAGNTDWSPQDDYPIYLNSVASGNIEKQEELYEEYDVIPDVERNMINENLEKISNERNRVQNEINNLINRVSSETDTQRLEDYELYETDLREINGNLTKAEQLQKQQLKTLENIENIVNEISNGVTSARETQLRRQLEYQNRQRENFIQELSQVGYEYW